MLSNPKAPSVVSRTCELSPACRSSVIREEQALYRAPFRLLSTRALRQAVLRASSRLAPSRSTSPCGLPVRKTRDASNRLLPPERKRLPVRRTFSIRHAAFTAWDAPRQSVAVALRDRGNEHFHDARSTSASSPSNTFPRAFVLAASGTSAGLFDTAALDGMRPLTPPSRALLPLRAHVTFVRARFLAPILMCSDAA